MHAIQMATAPNVHRAYDANLHVTANNHAPHVSTTPRTLSAKQIVITMTQLIQSEAFVFQSISMIQQKSPLTAPCVHSGINLTYQKNVFATESLPAGTV
jgi:hypothetical protein